MEAQHSQNQAFRLRRVAILHFCSICKKGRKLSRTASQSDPKILPNLSQRPPKSNAKNKPGTRHHENASKTVFGARMVENGSPKETKIRASCWCVLGRELEFKADPISKQSYTQKNAQITKSIWFSMFWYGWFCLVQWSVGPCMTFLCFGVRSGCWSLVLVAWRAVRVARSD